MKAPSSIRPFVAPIRRRAALAVLVATAAVLCLLPSHAVRADLATNLQLYSSMNNTTPYVHQAYWGDASGNSYDGQAFDVPSYDGGGNRSTAVDFTGTTNRMKVQSGYDSLLDAGTGDFSVSLWYYEMAISSYSYLLTSGNNASSARGGFVLASVNGVPRIRMNDVAEGNGNDGTVDTRLGVNSDPDFMQDISGAWHHLVAVFDRTGTVTGTANNVQLYVDNVMKNSVVLPDVQNPDLSYRPYNVLKSLEKNILTNVTDTTHGDPVFIGGQGTTSNAFTGYMDDLAVYRGALSAGDVGTLYSASSVNVGTITTSGITPVMIHNFENNLGRSSETLGEVPDNYGANAAGTMKNFRQVTDATRGEVIEVDGFSNLKEYVDYGDVLDPMDQSYTASIWFKIEDTGDGMTLMGKGMNNSTGDIGWCVKVDEAGILGIRANHNGTGTKMGVKNLTPVNDDEWHHVAVVFDRESGVLKGYLDGAGSGASGDENGWEVLYTDEFGISFEPDSTFDSTQPLFIGYTGASVTSGGKDPAVGRFDDFAVWNRVLTDTEILGIYDGTLTFPTPTPPDDIPGDANNDGKVDAEDAKALAGNWGKSGDAAWGDGDFNGDLKVDAKDAAILAANWGYIWSPAAGAEGAIASVPEPGTLTLLLTLLAGVATGFARRRVA
ncbi:MAG: PEP-CTERM sorting domain-containing protein [Pirellulaceae bacterium]|nr:PEP-CTERM sorting domain-containing protein [Pirellulaceae bacterium]